MADAIAQLSGAADFVKLAEAFGARAFAATSRRSRPGDRRMLDYDGPVLFDCVVEKGENCFPMIPRARRTRHLLADLSDDAGVAWRVIDERARCWCSRCFGSASVRSFPICGGCC